MTNLFLCGTIYHRMTCDLPRNCHGDRIRESSSVAAHPPCAAPAAEHRTTAASPHCSAALHSNPRAIFVPQATAAAMASESTSRVALVALTSAAAGSLLTYAALRRRKTAVPHQALQAADSGAALAQSVEPQRQDPHDPSPRKGCAA